MLGLLLAACGGKPPGAPVAFAESVGGWKLAGRSEPNSGAAAEPMKRFGVRRIERAEYTGAGKASIEVYTLSSEAGGLELEQTWRPQPDTVVFHRGERFAVVRWEGAGRDAAAALVRDLEKRLSAADLR